MADIDIFKVLDFIRDNSEAYAQAKAERIYLEEYRKTKKAILMRESGLQAANAQEAYAYAHPDYENLLAGLKEAIAEEERLRWLLVAAQAKAEVWRSLESTRRTEAKIV